jgi:hypothetical protein
MTEELTLEKRYKIEKMKASITRTVTESRTGQYFSYFSNSMRTQWAQYRNFNR